MTLQNPLPLPEGGKITDAGIYNLPMSVYHGDCCDAPSISSSGLRTIWNQSPAHYWYDSPYNPNRPEPKERPHFSIGRAAHHLIYMGRKGFDEEFVVRPDKWKDWRTVDAQEWRRVQLKLGKTVITDGELEQITGMARSLAAHPLVKSTGGRLGILDGFCERSLIFKDPLTGVWLKSRPDNIPSHSGLFADLKTTDSVTNDSLDRSLANFGYHMQAALAGMASEVLLGRPMEEFALVWVEKAPPHCVRVTVLTGADLDRGRQQLRVAINQFARAVETGNWHGPGGDRSDGEYLMLPAWAAKRIDDRLEVAANNDNHQTEEAA